MKKISFAAFGAVFGGLVVGGADASIISRGFLDEALESYATTTALDLKADKADLTALSDKIGNAWPYMFDMAPGLHSLSGQLYPLEINLENTSDLVRFLFGGQIESGINEAGVLNILGQSVVDAGAYDVKTGQIDDGFRSLTQLTNGWTDSKKKSYRGVRGLNDVLLWPTSVELAKQTWAAELFGFNRNVSYAAGTTIKDVLSNMFVPTSSDYANNRPNFYEVGNRIFNGGLVFTDSARESSGLTEYKGLFDLTKEVNKIGTLPEGITVQGMYEGWMSPSGINTLGLSQVELDSFLVYNPRTDSAQNVEGLKGGLLHILKTMMSYGDYSPTADEWVLAPFWKLTQSAYKTDELSTKIGTLPSVSMTVAPIWSDSLFQYMYQDYGVEPIYPTSLAGLMELLFGNNAHLGILQLMLSGFPLLLDNSGDGIGLYPNYILAKEANDKIGRLPTEYSTVGAALSAMDAKIDAHELPADSDDGQYVLSAKKVGDTITYTWVKMDLTDAEK